MNTRMNIQISRSLIVLFLLGVGVFANAQTAKPVSYSTAPKLSISKLKTGEADAYDVRGKITFTVTAANSDDTVAGTVNYTLPDDARQKIASMTGKQLSEIPASVTRKDVIAQFAKGTGGSIINLEINSMDLEAAGTKVYFNRVTLD